MSGRTYVGKVIEFRCSECQGHSCYCYVSGMKRPIECINKLSGTVAVWKRQSTKPMQYVGPVKNKFDLSNTTLLDYDEKIEVEVVKDGAKKDKK